MPPLHPQCKDSFNSKTSQTVKQLLSFFIEESEISDVTRVLPFLTSSSLSKTCARLGSSESTNHIGGVDG